MYEVRYRNVSRTDAIPPRNYAIYVKQGSVILYYYLNLNKI